LEALNSLDESADISLRFWRETQVRTGPGSGASSQRKQNKPWLERTGLRVCAAAGHALDEGGIGNLEKNNLVRVDVCLLKRLGLLARAGKM
jgi:hypothetical protein